MDLPLAAVLGVNIVSILLIIPSLIPRVLGGGLVSSQNGSHIRLNLSNVSIVQLIGRLLQAKYRGEE